MAYGYRRRYYGARRIQRAWRKRRFNKKKVMRPRMVRKIVHNMEPTRADIFNVVNDDVGSGSTLINNLTNITFNDDPSVFNTRQQTKVKLMSFNWRGYVKVAASATDNIVRLMIVKKVAIDGDSFDPRKCFYQNPGTSPTLLFCQINKRYCKCLKEWTFQLQNQDPSSLTNEQYPTIPWRRMLNIHFKFPSNCIARYPLVANATNVQPNNEQYYFIGVSDSSVQTPELTGLGTLFFKNV